MKKPKRPKLPKAVLEFFQETGAEGGKARAENRSKDEIAEWGSKGGKSRAEKYGAEQLKKWGAMGGRPPKDVPQKAPRKGKR